MALSRSFLAGMGLDAEKIAAIIEAHTESTDALKSQRDAARKDADEAKAALDKSANTDSEWKKKFDKVNSEFDAYKTDQKNKETRKAKEAAYTAALKKAGVIESSLASVLKATDFNGIEIGEDGKLKNEDAVTEQIKTDWSGFIKEEHQHGAATPDPAGSGHGARYTREDVAKMSAAEINKNWAAVQEALKNN